MKNAAGNFFVPILTCAAETPVFGKKRENAGIS